MKPRMLPILIVLLAGCRRAHPPLPSHTWTAMGTYANVTLGRNASGLDRFATLARVELEGIESRLSLFRSDSDIARLNAADGAWVTVDPVTWDILKLSRRYAELSDGAFDCTIKPLMALWGFRGGVAPEALPGGEALEAALARVGWRGLEAGADGVRLVKPGAGIDLGGIAKGYGVDRALEAMLSVGASNLLVNLGGNMRAVGQPEPGRGWRVGVRHPVNREALLGYLELPDGYAVATSGDYEKFMTIGGKRYAHIMDPRTGRPVSGMLAVTVMAPTAVEADALSTALFVAGLQHASHVLPLFPGCEALMVPDREPMELRLTPGFRERFHPAANVDARLFSL